MNEHRPKFLTIILIIVSIVIFSILTNYLVKRSYNAGPSTSYTVSGQISSAPTEIATNSINSNKDLETAAFSAVEKSTNGIWDKKVEINHLDATQKAAKGSWYAHDAWDWIAWQQTDGKWNVLVSKDGFNCKELDTVPSEYNSFFQDVIYMLDANKKYCL